MFRPPKLSHNLNGQRTCVSQDALMRSFTTDDSQRQRQGFFQPGILNNAQSPPEEILIPGWTMQDPADNEAPGGFLTLVGAKCFEHRRSL